MEATSNAGARGVDWLNINAGARTIKTAAPVRRIIIETASILSGPSHPRRFDADNFDASRKQLYRALREMTLCGANIQIAPVRATQHARIRVTPRKRNVMRDPAAL